MTSNFLKGGKTDYKSANQERSASFNRVNGKPLTESLGMMPQPAGTLEEYHPSPTQDKTANGKDVITASKTEMDTSLFSLDGGYNNSLTASSSISKNGGVMKIGNTGVKLEIPPDAFQNNDEEHEIQIKIIPYKILDEEPKCFEDHSTTMVEILPNKLQLKKFAILTLPHCLIVRDEKGSKVKVFQSHHTEGEKPNWEDISESSRPEVVGTLCKLMLKEFSWIRFNINGECVEGKKLFIYTLGEKIKPEKNCVTALVGYFPGLPEHTGADTTPSEFEQAKREKLEDQRLQRYFTGGHWQSFIFQRDPRNSLKISIESIIPPNGWEASSQIGEQKSISYRDIELSQVRSCPFTFHRKPQEQLKGDFPTCHFKVLDLHAEITIFINLERGVTEEMEEPETFVPPCEPMETSDVYQGHAFSEP